MLALPHARKPAPSLAARGMWLRLHGGPDAFGQALGDSIVGSIVQVEAERAKAKWDAQVDGYLDGIFDDPQLGPIGGQQSHGVTPGPMTLSAKEVCFLAGTLVHTKNGLRPIEQIAIGDWVAARHEANSEGPVHWRKVLNTMCTPERAILNLLVQHPTGEQETISATPKHPFFVNGAAWRAAEDLIPGDQLYSIEGAHSTFLKLEPQEGLNTVYNFSVEEDHTYFVGHRGTWVHNECEPNTIGGLKLFGRGETKDIYARAKSDAERNNEPGTYLALSALGAVSDFVHDGIDATVAAWGSPREAIKGAPKAIGNLGTDWFNGAVNTLKTGLDGYSLLGEGVGLFEAGAFQGFRNTTPYNIDRLFNYDNSAQAFGAGLTNLTLGFGLEKYGGYEFRVDPVSSGGVPKSQMGGVAPIRLVKPDLITNSKHVPGGDGYSKKAGTQPADYAKTYEKAITHDNGKNWYGASTNGQAIYRYGNGNDGTAHWNGSTADAGVPLTRRQVPPKIVQELGFKPKGAKWK